MSLVLRVVTLPFVPSIGGFDPAPLEALSRQAEILEATPAFFERGGVAYWSIVVACRLRASATGVQPGATGAASRWRGREAAGAAAPPPPGSAPPPGDAAAPDPGSLQALRQWRVAEADRRGVPVFLILTNRQLAAVAARWPGGQGLPARARAVQVSIPLRWSARWPAFGSPPSFIPPGKEEETAGTRSRAP